jgi:protein-arginine kinase activator protein McsA
MSVVPLFRCQCCGKAGAHVDLLDVDSKEVTTVVACDGCVEESLAHLARVRPVHDAMLAVGVPEDVAQALMNLLLELWPSGRAAPPAEG